MHPTKTLTDKAIADWWNSLQVYQRAQWLHDHGYSNITCAQFAWSHLIAKEQASIWIIRQRELRTA